MSRPRFLADNDLNEHIVDGVLRREPTLEEFMPGLLMVHQFQPPVIDSLVLIWSASEAEDWKKVKYLPF
jgi:hypothetical protein